MKVKNGKILQVTESELFEVYLKGGFDYFMSFTDYKLRCIELGAEVIEEGGKINRLICRLIHWR